MSQVFLGFFTCDLPSCFFVFKKFFFSITIYIHYYFVLILVYSILVRQAYSLQSIPPDISSTTCTTQGTHFDPESSMSALFLQHHPRNLQDQC